MSTAKGDFPHNPIQTKPKEISNVWVTGYLECSKIRGQNWEMPCCGVHFSHLTIVSDNWPSFETIPVTAEMSYAKCQRNKRSWAGIWLPHERYPLFF